MGMKQFVRALVISGISGILLVAFQNCSGKDVAFSNQSSLVPTLDSSPSATNTGDGSGVAITPQTSPSPTPSVSPSKAASQTSDNGKSGNGDCNHDGRAPKDGSIEGEDSDSEKGVETDHDYVCVLDGPAQSIKVGLKDATVTDLKAKPKEACMSKNACLNVVSQQFAVKGAAFRESCKDHKSDHTELSDNEVQHLCHH